MITREALLKKSIQEFQDNENNTLVYKTERIITKSGFMYILKLPYPKVISCAIHFNRTWETDEDLGKIEAFDYEISSREYIEPESLIEYQGINIAYLSYQSFNETMKQYTYSAVSQHGYNNKFIILDKAQIEDNLSVNCFPLVYEYFKSKSNIPVFPSLFNVSKSIDNSNYKFINVDIPETETINITANDYHKVDGLLVKTIRQNNNDKVKLVFVNTNQKETYTILNDFQEYLTNSQKIGMVKKFNVYQKEIYQMSFNIKGLVHIVEFELNYNLIIQPDQPEIKAIDLTELLSPLVSEVDKSKLVKKSSITMLNKV